MSVMSVIRAGQNPVTGVRRLDTCSLYQKKLFGEERNLIVGHFDNN